jgi:ABC-2 type transport system ATP-binding protein
MRSPEIKDADMPAITVRGLRKAYGEKVVLADIDLDIPAGSIVALLGPNGAGKTTTVNILSTLVAADGGSALVAGHDPALEPDAVRAVIGLTGQFSAVDGLLTGEENLVLMADLHHLDRAEGRRRTRDLLERFDLVEASRKPAATYSGGMRRRLDLAMGLIGRPQVLFLDEPSTGLDPRSRRALWDMIRELAATGVTVLLTTQYLEEADQLADRIAVLDQGRIVATGTADELKSLVPGGHVRLTFPDTAGFEAAARVLTGAVRDEAALALQVTSGATTCEIRNLLDELDRLGIEADRLSVHTPDLDDVFLALTGRPTPEEAISR